MHPAYTGPAASSAPMNKLVGRGKKEGGGDLYVCCMMCVTFRFMGCLQGWIFSREYTMKCVQTIISDWTDGWINGVNKKCQTRKDLLFSSWFPCGYFCELLESGSERCAMYVLQDGLFTEGWPEWMEICFGRGDRQYYDLSTVGEIQFFSPFFSVKTTFVLIVLLWYITKFDWTGINGHKYQGPMFICG